MLCDSVILYLIILLFSEFNIFKHFSKETAKNVNHVLFNI